MSPTHLSPGAAQHEPLGFQFEIKLLNGTSAAEQTQFQRVLEDHLAAQGLSSSLTQWMAAVWKEDTDLTLGDQCDLLCWLAAQPLVCAALVSELRPVDGVEDVEGPRLRIDVYSAARPAGCLLYALGLITPEVFAQVLGGFVVPHRVE